MLIPPADRRTWPRFRFHPASGLLIALMLVMKAALADPAEVSAHLRTLLTNPAARATIDGVEIRGAPLLRQLYAARGYRPLWSEPARQDLVAAVAASFADGLRPADYPAPTRAIAPELPPDARARQDIILSEGLTRLAYSLRFGKANPQMIEPDWNYTRALGAVDPVAWLTASIAGNKPAAALDRLRPQARYYRALRAALARHRRDAADGAWPTLSRGPTLKPGMRDARVIELRARLAARTEPPAAQALADPLYDAPLAQAVRVFQAQHGLTVDAAVGPATRAALNTPVTARIDTLRVNLERIRWLFHDLNGEYLAVNIAGFDAVLVEQGRVAWQSRVVVGRPYRQTPQFKSAIDTLELNPTWTVPPTILAEDILPAQRRDPSTLAKRKLQVLDRDGRLVDPSTIDWSRTQARGFPYVLRQPPGPDNALGRIKFLFPNRYAVYLHDTPARELFRFPSRSFSSGCIRVEHPLSLAERLLEGDPDWTPAAFSAALDSGVRQRIKLERPMPVMLLYLTAFPDAADVVQFRADVYRRDPAVLAALDGPFRFSAPRDYRPTVPLAPNGPRG